MLSIKHHFTVINKPPLKHVLGENNVPVKWTKHLLTAADQAQFLAPSTQPDFHFCIAATASLDLGPAH